MDIRSVILAIVWAALGPFAEGNDGWRPADHAGDELALSLETAHATAQRPHERWLPQFSIDWQRSRDLALDMVCDLGLIALALTACESWAALDAPQGPHPAAGGSMGGLPSPDLEDIRRRPIEQRMNSI